MRVSQFISHRADHNKWKKEGKRPDRPERRVGKAEVRTRKEKGNQIEK